MSGLFIVLEGIDGAGKSTHADWLEQQLVQQGRIVIRTREPGGCPLSEQLRQLLLNQSMDPVTELLLMFAARKEHIETVIKPALQAGQVVICDRFTDSTFAYQGGGRGLDQQLIRTLQAIVQGTLRPDLTFVFDLDPLIAYERIAQSRQHKDRFEQEQIAFFQRVRQVYLDQIKHDPQAYCLLNSTGDINAIQQQIWQAITRLPASH